jgi:hypothetical protein
MFKTRDLISSYYIGSCGGRGTVGRRGKWDCGSQGKGLRRGRSAGRGAVCEGESIPRRMSQPPSVSGGKRRRGERDVRRCRPTLHRRARSRHGGGDSRGGAGLRCTDGPFRDRKAGLREEVTIHVAQIGTLPLEGPEEERGEGGERIYPSTLHRRVPFSHQKSRERRLSPRKRLRKIGSYSSLNS